MSRKRDLSAPDDGLELPEVGPWAEDKYRLLWTYADLFATSMKGKWQRVYVDLFAGAGCARVKGTQRILLGSPLLALRVRHAFDKYIFCEAATPLLSALRARVAASAKAGSVDFVPGDVNENASAILASMPAHSADSRVLAFCFADPFRLSDLRFATIATLAQRFVDFLVLIPTGMDGLRNEQLYLAEGNNVVAEFLGNGKWRESWFHEREGGRRFDAFLAEEFGRSMKELGYLYGGLGDSKLIRSTEKNLPLYRLSFFSRSVLGGQFWEEARKYSFDQHELF
jgi:three-Cys-motif partner protein